MDVRRITAALLFLPLLALGACGGSDTSIADPPVSSPPSSSAPTAKPPHQETPEHFIRRWVELEKKMENTGDARPYLAVSAQCAACRKLVSKVALFYTSGGYVKWGGWHIISVRVNATNGHSITYAVLNDSAETVYQESSETPTKHLDGGRTTELLTLKRIKGEWQVLSKAELAS